METPLPAAAAATLDRGGVSLGMAEYAATVEELPEIAGALVIDTGGSGRDGTLLLFVVMRPGCVLDDALRRKINARLRTRVSPRHLPGAVYGAPALPRTPDGKKLVSPVALLLTGVPLERAVNREALANPEALAYFVDLFNNL